MLHSKTGKIYQMTPKYTKLPQNIPIYILVKNIPFPRLSKIFSNWDFGYANKPTDNPGEYQGLFFMKYVCSEAILSFSVFTIFLGTLTSW
jgi:hypothetical protein